MAKISERCVCRDCGASHVREKPPLARYCLQCFDWLSPDSRAKYCSPECRQKARQRKDAPPQWAPIGRRAGRRRDDEASEEPGSHS